MENVASVDLAGLPSLFRRLVIHRARLRRGWMGPLVTLVVLLFSSAAAADDKKVKTEDVGFVLSMTGEWLLNGAPIRWGQALPAQGEVQAKSPNARANSIVIALLNGRTVARSCDTPGSCLQPILLPQALRKEPDFVERIMMAVQELFGHHPEKYIATISRSSAGNLQEAVVSFRGEQLDLSPVFKLMEKGRYRFQLQPIDPGKDLSGAAPTDPVAFSWDPSHPTSVTIPPLKLGLYEISLLNWQAWAQDPPVSEAWVLVCGVERYESVSASFREAVKLTGQWGADVKRSTVRSFLRAYLSSLAKAQKP